MGLFKDCGCGCNGKKQEEKFVISVISGLTFYVIANPETFRLVRRILGSSIASPTGCPTTIGLLVHMLVFILVVWGMMNIKKDAPVKASTCGCDRSKKKGEKKVVQMVDVLNPEPNFAEPQLTMVDSGSVLEPLDLNTEGSIF